VIQLTPQMKVLLAIEPVDFRKGIDGLASNCRQLLDQDPFSGIVFVFRNSAFTKIKLLVYDGQGFWLCQKRLSRGRFQWWPSGTGNKCAQTAPHDLIALLWNGQPERANFQSDWRSIDLG
jgi:transposase